MFESLGQLLEALAHGYDMALLMTSHNKANSLDAKVFQVAGIGLATVNSKGELKIIVEPKITRLTGEI